MSTEWRKTAKRSVAAQREMLKRMDSAEKADNLQKLQCIADHSLQEAAQMIGDEYDDDMSKILEPALAVAEKAVAVPAIKAKGPAVKQAKNDRYIETVVADLIARGVAVTANALVKATEHATVPADVISKSTAGRYLRRRRSAD